jgi:hypothetical protein
MRRLGSSRIAVGVVLCLLVAAVVVVASAQAAPSKKNYTLQVAVKDDTVSHQTFTITLANDGSSNASLGSANISPPAGFTFDTTPGTAGIDRTGWTTAVVGNVLQLRSSSSAVSLAPGDSLKAFVRVASPTLPTTGCSASWPTPNAKQSNDFNGTNNWFTFQTAGSDLTPLGSFGINPIGSPIDVIPFFTPAILLEQYASTTTAYDTCHNVKTTYSGADLTHVGLTGASYVPDDGQTLSWASGVGTVKITPIISETDNTITVTDPTTLISDTSDPFDTQQKICTEPDATGCTWKNDNGSISASAPKPATGSLGVGFNPNVKFSGDCTGDSLGKTMITIAPHDTPAGVDYQVTIVYAKSVSGTGNANGFIVCVSTDDGGSFQVLPSCSSVSGTPLPDCVVDQKRISGGALQIILNLNPADPYVGGK